MESSFSEVEEYSLLESLLSSVAELDFLSLLALVDLVGFGSIPEVFGLAPDDEVVPGIDVVGVDDEGIGVGAVPLLGADVEPVDW